jgi:triacylglycerol lipase
MIPAVRRGLGVAAALAAMLAVVPAASAAPYPVSYSFPHAVADTLGDPTGPPPGANNWSCKPTAAHPDPVILVHGLLANMADNWDTMSPMLADTGFCVFALTYGATANDPYFGGLEAMEQSSYQLAAFVDRVLAATHARKVDLVGHSEGTVMPRYYMEFLGGASKVARYVMLAPLWHGTDVLGTATLMALGEQYDPQGTNAFFSAFADTTGCQSCTEFISGSSFLNNLDAHGMALKGVTYTDIVTEYDELVVPYTSGILNAPHVTNIVLQKQCPLDGSEHLTVAYDPVVAQDILNALDPARAKPVPCVPVIPGVGAPAPPAVGLR